jgi:hypothetical protein
MVYFLVPIRIKAVGSSFHTKKFTLAYQLIIISSNHHLYHGKFNLYAQSVTLQTLIIMVVEILVSCNNHSITITSNNYYSFSQWNTLHFYY